MHVQLDPIAMDIYVLNQRCDKGSPFMLRSFE